MRMQKGIVALAVMLILGLGLVAGCGDVTVDSGGGGQTITDDHSKKEAKD
jgi:hypothetical protein